MEDTPIRYANYKVIPEEIEKMKQEDGNEDLVFHPPDHPNAVFGEPSFRGFSEENPLLATSLTIIETVSGTYGMRSNCVHTDQSITIFR